MGHIIGAYTYISVHTKGHIDDFIDRQGLGGFFCWGGGGLGWITGEGASVSGDKHIFNGWRGGGGYYICHNCESCSCLDYTIVYRLNAQLDSWPACCWF